MSDRLVLFVSGPWHGQVIAIKAGVSVVAIEGIIGREYVRNHDDSHEWFEWHLTGWQNPHVVAIRQVVENEAFR